MSDMMMPGLSEKFSGKIVVVDDEPHQRLMMEEAVRSLGYEVFAAETGMEALEKLRFGDYDILLTDMHMPNMDGIRLLENVQSHAPSVSVIVLTAHGTVETAVEAMKKGAEDYILKPVEFTVLDLTLKRVFKKRQLVRENRRLISENETLKRDLGLRYHLTSTIGRSELAQKLQVRIEACMKNKAPLLILGEIGSGKSDIARVIHYNSPWAKNDLIHLDCAQIPDELQEVHLFGSEVVNEGGVKVPARAGLVEKAHMGTLVISNIHKLNKACQPRLSKVLREEKTQRLNGRQHYHVYVRVIGTAQKADFDRVVAQKEFRQDLHELLLENILEVPPLRDRKEDVPVLIAATARRFGQSIGKEITKIDAAVVAQYENYDFPGNLNELETMVETAVIRCNEQTLKVEHFKPLAGAKK